MSEVGTLKELGVKEGDRVVCVSGSSRYYTVGKEYTVGKRDDNGTTVNKDETCGDFRVADQTVNYNDGNWHGWNGGECPVHPESLIDCVLFYEECVATVVYRQCGARKNDWTRVVKFRVTKEHKEPREITVDGITYREVKE